MKPKGRRNGWRAELALPTGENQTLPMGPLLFQAWHAWAVMNFEAVLHYKLQNQARDEKKKLRHASGTSVTSANTEGSNSESEAESAENSPAPSPVQKKVMEVRLFPGVPRGQSLPLQ